jgi:hypothetical protein
MNKIIVFLSVIFAFITLPVQSQIRISQPALGYSASIMTVKYDITGCGSGEYVNIKLVVLNSKGDTIRPVYITGDLGAKINCGLNKTIIWNVGKDNIKIDEDLQISILGEKSLPEIPAFSAAPVKKISRGGVMISSLFVPGLGQMRASGKGGYLVLGALAYGGLGSSIFFNIQSKKYFNDYQSATGSERDRLFNLSQKSYDKSQYLLYGTAGVWAINMIWSAFTPINENKGKNLHVSLIQSPSNGVLFCAKLTF